MQEVPLNGHEISILDKEPHLDKLSFKGRITKDELKALSTRDRDQLKVLLSSNKDIANLIDEINQEDGDGKDSQNTGDKKGEQKGVYNNGNRVENEKEVDMQEIEISLRKKGLTDIYILFRGLELGFVPTTHNLKFKDPTGKFRGNKWNWVKHKGVYLLAGGPLTNGNINTKLPKLNIQLDNKVKQDLLGNIYQERQKIKNIFSTINNLPDIDKTNLTKFSRNLDGIENAINSGNIEELMKLKNEYYSLRKRSFASNYFKEGAKKLINERKSIEKQIKEKKRQLSDIQNQDVESGIRDKRLERRRKPVNGSLEKGQIQSQIRDLEREIKAFEIQRDEIILRQSKLKELKRVINNPNIKSEELIRVKEEFDTSKIIKSEKTDLKKIEREIAEIEARINKIKEEAQLKLQELDSKAGKDPKNIEKYREEGRQIIEKTNKELIELNNRGINNISGLNIDEIKQLSKNSTMLQKLEKCNGGFDKIIGSKGGKIFMSVAILSIAFDSVSGVEEMWKRGLTWENAKDVLDMAVGFIPVVGGINDLYVYYSDSDWNGRALSDEEKKLRLGFGIVGIIPGAGLLVKGAGKVATLSRVVRIAEVGVEGARLGGKIGVYGYLGWRVGEDFLNIYEKI